MVSKKKFTNPKKLRIFRENEIKKYVQLKLSTHRKDSRLWPLGSSLTEWPLWRIKNDPSKKTHRISKCSGNKQRTRRVNYRRENILPWPPRQVNPPRGGSSSSSSSSTSLAALVFYANPTLAAVPLFSLPLSAIVKDLFNPKEIFFLLCLPCGF